MSERTTWTGVRLKQVHRAADDLALPALPEHYICINIGRAHHLALECDGHTPSWVRGRGDIVLTPAGLPTRWRRQTEGDGLHLYVQPAFLAQVAEAHALTSCETQLVPTFGIRDPQIEHISFALRAEWEQGCPNGRLYGECLATALAAHLLRRYGASRPPAVLEKQGGLSPSKLRHVLDFMQDRLDQDLTVAQIAEAAGLSPHHFARLFRQSVGFAPHEYLIECRVERAKQMLRAGASAGEAAAAVGFADQSHLARHFKRLLGVTPARFSKQ